MWKNILEAKVLRLSRVKMEYLICNFNNKMSINKGKIRMDDIEVEVIST